ncbi:cysteine proteinase, partial [Testicularia cyperi]
PLKSGGAGSRAGTPSSARGGTPATASLDLSSAPGSALPSGTNGEAASSLPAIRKIPAGCPHLTSLLGLGPSDTAPGSNGNSRSSTQGPKIKSEHGLDDVHDSEGSSGGLKLSDKARSYLKRYAAGVRWGQQLRSGEIKMMDDEEREAEQTRFQDSIRKAEKEGRRVRKRKRLDWPHCHTCEADVLRPFICLDCAFTGCFMVSDDGSDVVHSATIRHRKCHLVQHLRQQRHTFAFDLMYGTLYCVECRDVVFDSVFETVLRRELARVPARVKGRSFGNLTSTLSSLPTYETASSAVTCRVPRGLRNMGATCFMNVIIQSFLHNPLLRNYFLADRHNPSLCSGNKTCLACEMDKMFAEFYSTNGGGKGPHGPTSFLYCMWMDASEELSQAGQHDAHELFISALNGIHAALTSRALERSMLPNFAFDDDNALNLLFDHFDGGASGSGTNSEEGTPLANGAGAGGGNGGVASCPCVVHRTFAGQLQSDVTCGRCGQINTTKDPMLDLSLDVRPDSMRRLANGNSKSGSMAFNKLNGSAAGLGGNGANGDDEEQLLTVCLQRYCSKEKLGNDDYSCANCGGNSTATKQLSLFRLPPVLCIQLKRFEHTSAAAKIDTKVRFPLVLDVREYSTAYISSPENSNSGSSSASLSGTGSGRKNGLNQDPEAYLYDLFTVVIHEGSMNTGHYTNYARWRDSWYRFDDDKVHPATEETVLNAKGAYQLCYRRRLLRNI